ncbi:MAG TPA: ATP synthase F0 subunit B [Bryobacteraceae bacterium]|nr:ATP synthase F0 subunit B [Bryobacteraceae bacterium]
MGQTFQQLGGLFIEAIPTAILLLIVHFYLKFMLFRPLRKVLQERDDLTEGARKTAQESLAAAERKAAEYEAMFREARAEVYRQQEETRRRWLEDQSKQVAEARERTDASVQRAKDEIAAEAAAARQNLLETSGALADRIASRVLARRVGGTAQ